MINFYPKMTEKALCAQISFESTYIIESDFVYYAHFVCFICTTHKKKKNYLNSNLRGRVKKGGRRIKKVWKRCSMPTWTNVHINQSEPIICFVMFML